MITGAECPRGWTWNVGLSVWDSKGSGSGFNPGGEPTKAAAVGGGKNVSSNELGTDSMGVAGTAWLSSSMTR